MHKVLKPFKCRHHKMKVFKVDNEYKSKNDEHTKKLVDLGYIQALPKQKTKEQPKKQPAKKTDKK